MFRLKRWTPEHEAAIAEWVAWATAPDAIKQEARKKFHTLGYAPAEIYEYLRINRILKEPGSQVVGVHTASSEIHDRPPGSQRP